MNKTKTRCQDPIKNLKRCPNKTLKSQARLQKELHKLKEERAAMQKVITELRAALRSFILELIA